MKDQHPISNTQFSISGDLNLDIAASNIYLTAYAYAVKAESTEVPRG
jgi:hypothetical protein